AGGVAAAATGPFAALDVWPLLGVDDVRAVTGYKGDIEQTRLADLPRTSFYDSHHFKAVGKSQAFDVALRPLGMRPSEALAQYQKLRDTLPDAKPSDEIGTRSLRAMQGEILGLVWYDEPHAVVAQVSCGKSQCPDYPTLRKLAELVEQRLDLLGAPPRPALPAPVPPAAPIPGGQPLEKPANKPGEQEIGAPSGGTSPARPTPPSSPPPPEPAKPKAKPR